MSSEDLRFSGDSCRFSETRGQVVNRVGGTKLFFTYSVEWRPSDVRWASRWDIYLGMNDVKIHWFSIINSLMVVFFLFGKSLAVQQDYSHIIVKVTHVLN